MMSGEENIFEELKEYYVYELVDPRNSEVFYVGKGKGERAHHHALEADRSEDDTQKLNRIREIKNSADEVVVRVIGRYDLEQEAFAVESTLIHWVYGKDHLTNVASGHRSDVIRPKGDMSEIPGIDIPPKERANDGSYSKAIKEERDNSGVVEFMEGVKASLEKTLNIQFGDVDISRVRYARILFELDRARIAIEAGINKTMVIQLEALSSAKADRDVIEDLCKNSRFESRNNGNYARLPNNERTESIEKIAHYVVDYLEELKVELGEESMKKRWSNESVALTREVFKSQNGCMVKSFDGEFGVGVRMPDGSYKVLMADSAHTASPLSYPTVDALIKSGWVVD